MILMLVSLYRSVCRKKAYTLLIICSVAISAAMFFASISLSGTLIKLQTDRWRSGYGYSDIVVQAGKDSPSGYFHISGAEKYAANMEYCIGQVSGYAAFKTSSGEKKPVSLRGIDLEGLQQLTPLYVYPEKGLSPFKGMTLLISKRTADKYHLEAGDFMVLDINGTRKKFSVGGIAENKGPFADESRSFTAVVPRDAMCSLYNVRGKVDTIYIKLLHPELKGRLMVRLKKEYGRLIVKEPFTEQEIKRQTDRIAAPVIIVAMILSLMSVYIIYTTFRVIAVERLPVIAAFRSMGATKRLCQAVMLSESLAYGIVGGGSGCGAGILLLHAMSSIMNPDAQGGVSISAVQFSAGQVISAFSLAIVLSLTGSLAPILKTSGESIKSLLGNISHKKFSYGNSRAVKGLVLIVCALAVPGAAPGNSARWIGAICVLMLLYGIVELVPAIIKILSGGLKVLYSPFFGNIGPLAVKNLQENKNLINNVSLLVIGISTFFMISTINYGETRQILDCFDRCLYDIKMEIGGATKSTLQLIHSAEGVKDAYADYIAGGVAVEGQNEPIWHLEGINTNSFMSFCKLNFTPVNMPLKELDNGRNILLTTALKDRFGLELDDSITLALRNPGGSKVSRQYRVIGFFENIYPGMWSHALISDRYYRLDIDHGGFGQIYIKSSGDTEGAVAALQSAFGRRKPEIITTSAQRQEARESNRQLFLILEGFSVMALAAGALGIANNLVIGLIQRRRVFAILRSIGMSRRQNTAMLMLESVAGGFVGGIAGIGAGFLATFFIVPEILDALQIETRIYYSFSIVAVCLATAFAITAAAALLPAFRLRGQNTAEALKYE